MLTDGTFNDHNHVDHSQENSPVQLTEFVLHFLGPWMLEPFLYLLVLQSKFREAR